MSVSISQLNSRLKTISTYAKHTKKLFAVSLSSSVEISKNSFFGGIRVEEHFIIQSLINISQHELETIAHILNQYCDYLLVDTEKKHPFHESALCDDSTNRPTMLYSNLLSASHSLLPRTKIIPWSPSRITSEAAICRLRSFHKNDLSGSRVSLIGSGSIGFKIAMGLVEEGCSVNVYSRNLSRLITLVAAINYVKSKFTIASATACSSLEATLASSPQLLLAANTSNYITNQHLSLLPYCANYILDISKASLSPAGRDYLALHHSISYERLDIGPELTAFFRNSICLSKTELSSNMPTRLYRDDLKTFLVSGGFPGSPGDFVVDNATSPTFKLGLIGSNFEFVESFECFLDL